MRLPSTVLLVLPLACPATGAETLTTLPWKVNPPIVTVAKEIYRRHPRAGAAALVSVHYIGPWLERMEVHALEVRDDVPSEPMRRVSTDNGRTWSPLEPMPRVDHVIDGVEVREHPGCYFYDPAAQVLLNLWLRQIPHQGLWHCFTYWRLSRDGGRTWTPPRQFRYEPGEDYDPADPLKPGFLHRNQGYYGNNIIRHSNGTLITCLAHTNAPNDPDNNKRPWRMGSVCFVGKWNAAAGDYEWSPGGRVEISPELSSRGLMEPEVAELRDGRVLVVWRGSNTARTPGHKWFSLSSDGGRTLSPPGQWRYDDGTSFYSPSSYHRMLRHSMTGRLYWFGNISAVAPTGNSPRYPLVIAEVDEEKAALKRSTVTVIDDRRPEQPAEIQFSNFSLLEDRQTHAIELYLTTYGQDPRNVFSADCWKYTLRLR